MTKETFKFLLPHGNMNWRLEFMVSADELELVRKTPVAADRPSHHNTNGSTKKRCCGGNRGVKIEKWLGIRWYGVPIFKRLRMQRAIWPIKIMPMKGCGCPVKTKATWLATKAWFNYVKRA